MRGAVAHGDARLQLGPLGQSPHALARFDVMPRQERGALPGRRCREPGQRAFGEIDDGAVRGARFEPVLRGDAKQRLPRSGIPRPGDYYSCV
jgi:hypothetical protein